VVARSVGIVQARLAALGVRGVRVEAGDGGTIRLSCDGCSAATLTAAERATAPAQLLFYDWEPNLLDARCRPAPAAGAGATSRYRAVLRAARCPARRYRLMSHTAPVYYAVDDARGRVLAGPGPSPSAVLAGGGRAVRVLPGTTVVADPENGQWYVLRDDAAVTGAETTDPRAETDGATGAPIVTLRFTPPGQSEMRTLTRRVARRGQARQLPGLAPQTAAQHFAVALDDRLLALPFVDFRANPDGIDSHEGLQIQGGFTKQSAQALAALLQSGSLPARLIPRPGP
jgi:SecD/SecF fusion protein